MELSKARPNQQLTQPSELSKLSKIVMLLGALAIRRQAKLTDQDYQVFASDLEPFEIADIEAGTFAIAQIPKEKGDTAFPEIADIKQAVVMAGRSRRTAEARERRIADEAAERRRRETHPEEFEAFGPADLEALAKKSAGKFSFERQKKAEPMVTNCPHCSGVLPLPANMRFWTASEVAAFAEILANSERAAAANREAHKAHKQLANLPATPVSSVDEEVA